MSRWKDRDKAEVLYRSLQTLEPKAGRYTVGTSERRLITMSAAAETNLSKDGYNLLCVCVCVGVHFTPTTKKSLSTQPYHTCIKAYHGFEKASCVT